jgi:hypothetical protein
LLNRIPIEKHSIISRIRASAQISCVLHQYFSHLFIHLVLIQFGLTYIDYGRMRGWSFPQIEIVKCRKNLRSNGRVPCSIRSGIHRSRSAARVSSRLFNAFVYANGLHLERFDKCMHFSMSVLPYIGNDAWVESKIFEIDAALRSGVVAPPTLNCEHCGYVSAMVGMAACLKPSRY